MNLKKCSKFQKNNVVEKALIALFLFLPTPLFASVEITEIMYDPEGSDSGREWLEIKNNGSDAVDLTSWKFFEEGSNHGLSEYQGGMLLGVGEYAVIVADPVKFLADWSPFAGILIDSSWSSFKNTGEQLVIRDETLTDRDVVVYDPSIGGAGDGTSLQKSGSTFVAAAPTPGEAFSEDAPISNQTASTESKGTSKTVDPFPVSLTVSIGKERTVFVGADSEYEAVALGNEHVPLQTARYLWTFGNGETKEGEKVLHHYTYPGKYIVRASVSSGKYSATDQTIVTAIDATVSITQVNVLYIEIKNGGAQTADLSGWYLASNGTLFQMPKGTLILKGESVRFATAVTGLAPRSRDEVALLYPNGVPVRNDDGQEVSLEVEKKVSATPVVKNTEVAISNMVSRTTNKDTDESGVATAVVASVPLGKKEIPDGSPLWVWIMGLVGVVGVGVASYLFVQEDSDNKRLSAKDFKIEEDID